MQQLIHVVQTRHGKEQEKYCDKTNKRLTSFKLNRGLQIVTRGRLQVLDFLNTEYYSRVNQRHFGGKT